MITGFGGQGTTSNSTSSITTTACFPDGAACATASECCAFVCNNNVCGASSCAMEGSACGGTVTCCDQSASCQSSVCCMPTGSACTSSCCDFNATCQDATCCYPAGVSCVNASDCCLGTTSTSGTCQ